MTTAVDLPGRAAAGDTRAATDGHDTDRPSVYFALLVAAAVMILVGLASGGFTDRIADTDTNSWMNRSVDLWETGDWFDDTVDRVEPGGSDQHWGRPIDVLHSSVPALLSPLVPFDRAIVWWVRVLPVLLGLATVFAAWHFFGRMLGRTGLLALALILPFQGAFLAAFAVGRADHHGLIVLMTLLLFGATDRHLGPDARRRPALWVGAAAALFLWATIETIIPVLVIGLYLMVRWVMGIQSQDALRWFTFGLAGGTATALLLGRGFDGFTDVLFDELSLFHAAGFAMAAAALWAVDRLDLTARGAKVGAVVVAGLGSLAVLWVAFPQLQSGPLVEVDPTYVAIRMSNIAEGQGLFDGGVSEATVNLITVLSPLPLAIVGFATVARRRLDRSFPAWWLFGLSAALHVILTVDGIRWGVTAGMTLSFAAALGAQTVAEGLPIRVGRPATVAAVAAFWWIVPLATVAGEEPILSCGASELVDVLDEADAAGTGLVVTWPDYGPQVLFETDHSVTAIPNHRLQRGFVPSVALLASTDETISRRLVADLDAEFIAICDHDAEAELMRAGPGSLHDRLRAGDVPNWLTPATTDSDVGFLVFTVETS